MKEYPNNLTAWCKFCDHKVYDSKTKKTKANCTRSMTIKGRDDAYKDRVRRFLWYWCYNANKGDRKNHQDMPRDLPGEEDLLPLEDIHELIELTYDSD